MRLILLAALLLAPRASLHAAEPSPPGIGPGVKFCEIAQPSGFPPQGPRLSDVCMRFFRLGQPGMTADRMIEAGHDFHITRCVWSYIEDEEFIRLVKSQGWDFQATLNLIVTDPALALRDRDGIPIRCNVLRDRGKLIRDAAGHAVDDKISPFRADLANPDYRRRYLERARRLVDIGATSFQRDDPDEGHFEWGDKWGKEGRRDAISDGDLLEFHSWARTEIEKHAGRTLTFSVNNHDNSPFTQVFDYRMTEVRFRSMDATKEIIGPDRIREIGLDARKEKKPFILAGQEDRPVEDYRWAWATSYATGNLYVVPWDQFQNVVLDPVTRNPRVPIYKLPRIFIAPEQFADLTGFVRANADILEGYEEAAVGGYDLPDARFGTEAPLHVEGGSGKLSVFVRAKPGDATAPVVVHLVERDQGVPATLRLATRRFFGKDPLRVKLRVPPPYAAALHAEAEKSGNYRSLLSEAILTPTTDGDWTIVPVPALNPWGILVVEKAP